jgi:hypothetical protein
MFGIRKRGVPVNEKKTYKSTDTVSVLGLVCEKMSEKNVRTSDTWSTGRGGQTVEKGGRQYC